jgi:predicted NAD/FAD-dependent oxidoreductase
VTFTKKISQSVYACGDSLSVGSMESALRSGRESAEVIAKEFVKGNSKKPDFAESN